MPKHCPSVQHVLHIRMQVASSDRRILMAGDALQDVQIDASVGHPGQGGVPSSVTSASQPVVSRKVAVVITPPGGPSVAMPPSAGVA